MNSESTLDSDLALAHRLADAAGLVSLTRFRQELRRWSKADGSLATDADFAVEDGLRALLATERPNDAVLGEERGQTGSGPRRWIIDGIDGTIAFAGGTPEWATLIALEVDGRVVVSVCDEPANERRYWAASGRGAFRGSRDSPRPEQALRVSSAGEMKLARSYVPPPEFLPDERARRIAHALAHATCPQPHRDHPALEVAAGFRDVGFYFVGGPWDLAGPLLVVEEAGGRFTDLEGRNALTSGAAIFSNGVLHDELLRVISAA